MNSPLLKKALPHIIAIVVFLVVSIAFNKNALEGKVLRQADVQGYTGMAKQSNDYKEKYGHWPLWTESMFSGMPAYNIAIEGSKATVYTSIIKLNDLFFLGTVPWKPISFFFSACVCFYILTQVFGLSLLISILGSIAYAFATFNPILVSAGHDTELIAIGYLPAVIAGVILILKQKYLYGTVLTVIFFSLEVSIQHLQIVYYTGIIIGILALVYAITHWKERRFKHIIISYFLIAASLLVGLMNFAYTLLPTKELVTETMRGGKSQLTPADSKNKTKGGLNKDYAFMWSYGIPETLTLFVPGKQGGGSAGRELSGSSKFADKLGEAGVPEETAMAIANVRAYWGDQPNTSGPVYLGAVICFLFILGMVYVKSWHKWWILAISIVGIVLAWGKNFSAVNYFLFDYFPLYSKFRAPSMALVMPQLGFALLAVLGLQEFVNSTERKEFIEKKFRTVLYVTGGLILLSVLVFLMSDFKSENDTRTREEFTQQLLQGKQPTPEVQQQLGQMVNAWMSALRDDRKDIFQADLIRSVILVILAAGVCWFYFKGKFKTPVLLAALLILSSYDLMAEAKKYLSDDTYTDPEGQDVTFTMTDADSKIKADPEKYFRVFDMSGGDPFQDSRASYFHNSVGGYHPAKLALYNDLIEHQLTKGNKSVFNMLNTKYIIQRGQNGRDVAMLNPDAFGSCWLVSGLHFVNNADEEMASLDSTNLRDTAIVENIYKDRILYSPIKDSTAHIQLLENLNDKISYSFKSSSNQFVVFSEIYYDKGWNAFIDSKPVPYCRVDYVLRGMSVPAGEHNIEFRFEPKSYIMGNELSVWSGILTYLLIILAALRLTGIYPKKKSERTI